jgi:catalase
VSGEIVRCAYTMRRDDDDFGQAGTMYRKVLDDAARRRLVTNLTNHLKQGVEPRIVAAAVRYLSAVDADLGAQVARVMEVPAGAEMSLSPRGWTSAERPSHPPHLTSPAGGEGHLV